MKATSGVVNISVQPSAVTTHGEVTIGDVAVLDGGDATLRSRISRLDLADAPQAGKATRLSRDLITHRIRIAGVDSGKFRVQGAEAVLVSFHGYKVPEEEIVDAAKQYLRSRMPWKADDVSIETAREIPGAVHVSGRKEDVRFEPALRAGRLALGTVQVDVTVFAKGVKQAQVPVSLEVHMCQPVAVASRRVARGQVLTADDIFFERRVVDNIAGYLTEAESPIGQKAKRPLQPLQAVTRGELESSEAESNVVVRQRDAVKLVARAGNLTITATGEALQDGRTGQMIRVRNVDSKNVVTGRVVNRNEVHVLY